MATDDRTDAALERLFQAGRADAGPSEAFMARLVADADAELYVPVPPVAERQARRPGIVRMIMLLLGGWPAMAGMATAAAAGVMIGFSSPDLVQGYIGTAATESGYTLIDFTPSVDLLASGE